ncbi:NADH-quinone oxidoreductase subunit NuoE [Candidatus Persebacteraceae bacterium Df01]|jgi:NADH-quinone oxidoreductase subunit E|uniref:NADH-quinone oxidoreductase subunit E n=1 Tax=Candidatus Doriopsillibacter californiensis TaxID=2970740 RepID=A0ABT7QJG8_9GAMM|nr:NADH-quinone oxidoreductase subunit NuoE [Candidatus Persebacteraceae bacterium Df01]
MSAEKNLSAESLAAIDREMEKYPPGKQASAVMSALRIAQKEKGWLADDTIAFVAEYLKIPAIRAYEVATFYNMYDLKPVGRNKLCLCTNLPCMLMGATETAAALKEALGVDFGETTADDEWTLREGECFGACGDAPAIIVNNEKIHSGITAEKVPGFLRKLRQQNDNASD